MRRWCLAFFVVHFCLCVGMFSFAHADIQAVPDPARAAQAVHDDAAGMPGLLAGVDEAEHGLTDGHADLPEFLHTDTAIVLVPVAPVYRTAVLHGGAPPLLANPHRPPIPTPRA